MITMKRQLMFRFQKYIIIYVLITTVVSLGIVLPVNFQESVRSPA